MSYQFDLICSIVLYNTDKEELKTVMKCVLQSKLKIKIYLVDNSPTDRLKVMGNMENVEYIFNNANLGYGAGHNIAINKAKDLAKYELVINPDVTFEPGTLEKAMQYMDANLDVGLISPQIRLPDGELQYFCRKLPTPFDVFARRFLPAPISAFFRRRLESYLLKHKDYSQQMNNIPNLPGAFMFMRMDVLADVKGFDENFFMYVEDVDLTRRIREVSKTVYYPDIVIKHGLARGSYKFSKLMVYHIISSIYYFNKWGWFLDRDRVQINSQLSN